MSLDTPLKRTHVHLFPDDLARLDRWRGDRLSRNKAIRLLLHAMLNRIYTEASKSNNPVELPAETNLTEEVEL